LAAKIGPVPDVLNYLGYAHRRLGRFDESLAYYQQALALDPMHRGANEYLGELFVELGEMDRAEERLAVLDRACPFGCAEYEDLKRRIESRVVAAR
ncbi:MAG: tetratricopeptide repeat protein, partial [Myxococcota bacterium]